ncbi:MAG: dTMP kinase [Leptothrix sp. (in: Bacteria)]|nr:dTMP kinase [Leptothrix sp. (in: b-proteobacteria)]
MTAPSASGRFITLEGIDGAGKSSHIDALAAWLRDHGHEVVVTREPGGTELAERLRELVLHAPMDALTEVLLVFAARRDHLVHAIEPALAGGATVLCDRFTDATFAYQGAGRGFDLDILAGLEDWVQRGRQPDLTLWFRVAPATAAARRAAARSPDRFESQGQDFFERVDSGYAARRVAAPQRFAELDAGADRAAVWAQIEAALVQRGWG